MFSLVSTLETIEEKPATKSYAGNKDESSTILDKYYRKQDSTVFRQLNEGDILDMEYNPTRSSGPTKLLKTQITSKNSYDRFKGHSLVELAIIDN
ncbi:MAG: hypothetical protein JRJ34_09275 [Deltaproteobacteria bacterium]|nr:hypothetical protein [Deltaproteobacteria bacterium]